jgi:diacylglycerol kinase (ATP)
MKKSILFIANPVSGNKNLESIIEIISKVIDADKFKYDIKITERAGEAKEMTKQNETNYEAIIAIGGDGTINEIASVLVNKNVYLGIIPSGSPVLCNA